MNSRPTHLNCFANLGETNSRPTINFQLYLPYKISWLLPKQEFFALFLK